MQVPEVLLFSEVLIRKKNFLSKVLKQHTSEFVSGLNLNSEHCVGMNALGFHLVLLYRRLKLYTYMSSFD